MAIRRSLNGIAGADPAGAATAAQAAAVAAAASAAAALYAPLSEVVTLPLDATNAGQIINTPGVPGAWTNLPSLTGMVNNGAPYGNGQYRLEAGSIVRFQGRIKASGAYTGGVTFATLDSTCHPAVSRQSVARSQDSVNASLQVASDGSVSYTSSLVDTHWLNLDGVTITL